MFEASLFESEGRIRTKNGRGIAVAAAVQAIAFSGLLLVPLFSTARLPQRVLRMTLAAPPPTLKPPPPLTQTTTSALQTITQSLIAPSTISHSRVVINNEPSIDVSVTNGSTVATSADVGNLLDKLGGAASTNVRPAAVPRGPVRVSSGVMQGQLDSPILPVYPSIARAAHMQGTVIVAAIVSRTGAIEKLHVLSGPMMLRQAALDAIQRAHYRPFKLNGEPVEVDTTISVVFALGDVR